MSKKSVMPRFLKPDAPSIVFIVSVLLFIAVIVSMIVLDLTTREKLVFGLQLLISAILAFGMAAEIRFRRKREAEEEQKRVPDKVQERKAAEE